MIHIYMNSFCVYCLYDLKFGKELLLIFSYMYGKVENEDIQNLYNNRKRLFYTVTRRVSLNLI